jgi:hypothetical protein
MSMKFGTVKWFSCMFEKNLALGWPPEAGKPSWPNHSLKKIQ